MTSGSDENRTPGGGALNGTGVPEGKAMPHDAPLGGVTPIGAITLVRHGRPSLERKGLYTASGWDEWWAAYERSGLAQGEKPPETLRMLARGTHQLVSSTRPRALGTARLLAGEREIICDALFVEAPLPAPPLPSWVRLSPAMWGILSRIVWLLGYAGESESRRMAEMRAEEASARLIALSHEGDVLLCAHGWFNRMMRRVLKAQGWRQVYDGGDRYWSWRRFLPPQIND